MKRVLFALILLGSAVACDDIDEALRLRREMADGGTGGGGAMGGGGGALGGGGGDDMDSGMPMGGGFMGGGTGGNMGGGGGTFDAGPSLPVCLDGFCWENPLPQGNTLNAVFGVSPADVWMVGEVGMVLRWQAGRLTSYQAEFPRSQNLTSVWGTPSKLWVVGTPADPNDPTMNPKRFDFPDAGWSFEAWSGLKPPELLAISGQDENNVWAVGYNGTIAQRLSGGWSSDEIYGGVPNVRGIALDSNGACKVAAESGLSGVGPCDGGPLELTLNATDDHIYNNGLWSPAPGVFYASGVGAMGSSYEGRIWGRENGSWDAGFRGDTFCGGGSGVGSFGLVFCGNGAAREVPGFMAFGTLEANDQFVDSWTPGTREGSWLVGNQGVMSRHDGLAFRSVQRGSRETVFSLFLNGTLSVAGGSYNRLFTRQADTSWNTTLVDNGRGDVRGLWMDSTGYRAFVGTERMLVEGTGTLAQAPRVDVTQDGGGQLNALWGTSKDDLWAVGNDSQIWHRTDAGWSRSSLFEDGGESTFWAIDGVDQNTAYVVGERCTVLARDTTADGGWTPMSTPCNTKTMFGVWAAPPNDAGLQAVAVGPKEETYFLIDGGWSSLAYPQQPWGAVYAVWGASPTQIWAVGQNGALLHYNGAVWMPVETGTRHDLHSVRGRVLGDGGVELFIGGDYGAILRKQF